MSTALVWIVVGFGLIIAEVFLTSFIVVFFGLAAIIVGLGLWFGMPTHSGIPYIVFAGLSVALLLGLRSRFREWFMGDVAEGGVDEDFIGREVQVESGFDDLAKGRGKVSYRGASWEARSTQELFASGAFARIVRRESTILFIEPLEPG